MTGFGTAILCGGLSRRMGEDKASLNWKGMPLARYKWEQFAGGSEEVFFSVRDDEQGARIRKITGRDVDTLADDPAGCGPLGGICTSLKHCREEFLFVTAVDMPYSDLEIAGELMKKCTCLPERPESAEKPEMPQRAVSPEIPENGSDMDSSGRTWDAVVPVTPDGKEHPLCAIYAKSCLPVLEKQLESGNYRVRDALADLSVLYVKASELTAGEKKLTNMNNQASYRKAVQAAAAVYSLIAWSDTGKTTYLENLIPALKKRGVRVAVIKHDGHDFDIDHEGTDSDRFTRAGADVSGIFSDTHTAILLNGHIEAEKLIFLISMSGTADLIITEGCKKGKWPKILLYRESSGKPMAADPDTCAAVVSDVQVQTSAPVFPLSDPDALAEFLTGSMLL